jgi:2-methylcitrate dehydratase PrpD
MIRRNFLKSSSFLMASSLFAEVPQRPQSDRESFPEATGLTKYVAEFLVKTRFEDIPEEVIELGKKSILDALGLALCGANADCGLLIRKYLSGIGCTGSTATVIGSNLQCPPRFAALANGISIHADDFDDTIIAPSNGLGIHPSVTILPAVFALSEPRRCSGAQMLLAYHVGAEVESKITEAVIPRNSHNAFHPTGTCGSIGSAAASSNLLRLDQEQALNAVGIAASEASGLRENFGTMTKPFNAGHAAENGVVAAELASLGWTASQKILESPLGFFRTESDSFRPELIVGRLGRPWAFENPGVAIKPFPSGALTHPAMGEMLRLIRQHDLTAQQVSAVRVRTSREAYATLIHHHPVTGLQAKFSMEFCLAILLLERRAGIGQFTDAVVQQAKVQQIMARVNYSPEPAAQLGEAARLMTTLSIELKGGQVIVGKSSSAQGSPENPMTLAAVTDKFHGCAEYAKWPKAKADAVVDTVRQLERLSDLNTLSNMLSK